MKRSSKGKWVCFKDDCELCEGKGLVFAGHEGFINRNLEQDVRDIFEPCEHAEYCEPNYEEE